MFRRLLLAVLALCACAPIVRAADVARLVDGSILKGQIVERAADSVTFLITEKDTQRVVDVAVADISFLMEDGKDPSETIDLDALRTGGAVEDDVEVTGDCYVIPLEGEFGKEIEAGPLAAALDRAVRDGVTNVVFDLESYGGAISTAQEITKVLNDYSDRLRFTVVVRRGISASIWLIFACDDVFVMPDATIGGAVAYHLDNTTGSAEVDAKFNSVIAAELEATATRKGHTASLVRAMIIPEVELWKHTDAGGRITLAQSRVEAPKGGSAAPLVASGQVLTLTAQEAVEIGLAQPIASANAALLGQAIDGRGWESAGDRAAKAYQSAMVECERIRITAAKKHADLIADLEKAGSHDPRRFIYSYNPSSRRLSKQSQQAWADRSRTSLDSFRRAKRHAGELVEIIERAQALRIPDPTQAGASRESLEYLLTDLDRVIMRLRHEMHAEFLPLDFGGYVPN